MIIHTCINNAIQPFTDTSIENFGNVKTLEQFNPKLTRVHEKGKPKVRIAACGHMVEIERKREGGSYTSAISTLPAWLNSPARVALSTLNGKFPTKSLSSGEKLGSSE